MAFGADGGAGGGVRVLRVMDSHTADDVCALVHTTADIQDKKNPLMPVKKLSRLFILIQINKLHCQVFF